MTTAPQLWVLLANDPTTGAATRPVGVLGVHGSHHHASWVPLEPAADIWRDRLNATSAVALDDRVEFWTENANGRTVDLAPLDAPADGMALRDAVETALDGLLNIEAEA
ncbi:MAG: hypothetical protein WD250_15165 [Egibacteraceae bacterium]